ncbi:unnamed protein product [Calypogeia fissa]
MGRSMRKFKKGKHAVKVGLPSKKSLFKKELAVYSAAGYVANPNLLGARDKTPHTVQSVTLQTPRSETDEQFGSDDEDDEVRTALNKLRKDGKKAPLQRLTKMQRVYVGRLMQKHGDNYEAMSRDIKLNEMQHPTAVLRKLCKQYERYEKAGVQEAS